MSEKKGNVVLIEAFVVLCLLFMLQYVISGVSEQSRAASEDGVFLLTLAQAQTNNDATSHFDAVRVNGRLLMLGGTGNCPAESTSPAAFDRVTSASGEAVPYDIRSFDPLLSASAPDDLQAYRDLLATQNVSFSAYQPGAADSQAGMTGMGILISGRLSALKDQKLEVEAFSCECRIGASSGLHEGYKFPHPLLVTLTTSINGHANTSHLVGYYPQEQGVSSTSAEGLLFRSDGNWPDPAPIKRYLLELTDTAALSTKGLDRL